LAQETKFTANSQTIKLKASSIINGIDLHIQDVKPSRMVRMINVYYNNKALPLGELKNRWSLWKKAKTLHLPPNHTDLHVDFPIPITATNILVEYASFHENPQVVEKLQCPRCSRIVTDKHGICKHCRENAYQCKQCRSTLSSPLPTRLQSALRLPE